MECFITFLQMCQVSLIELIEVLELYKKLFSQVTDKVTDTDFTWTALTRT